MERWIKANTVYMGLAKVVCFALLFNVCRSGKVKLASPELKSAKPFTNGSASLNQWKLVGSGTDYRTCSIGGISTDSYLVLKFAQTAPANEILVEVEYELLDCAPLSPRCKYAIDVYALRVDLAYSNYVSPMEEKYFYVSSLQNQTVLSQSLSKFLSRLRIGMAGQKGIYLAFRDTGICGSIKSINIWYFSCNTEASLLLNFMESPAPNSSISVIHVNGICVAKSIPLTSSKDNFVSCYTNGTIKAHGGCKCDSGYVMVGKDTCEDCPPKTFKPNSGNGSCYRCGKNVKDGLLPRKSTCLCHEGFFRPVSMLFSYSADCEEPPSAPRRLNTSVIKSQWALISWDGPAKNGTGDTVSYSINCKQCETTNFKSRGFQFNLTNLKTYTIYNITVFSVNNVTKAVEKNYHAKMSFRTLSGLPSAVQDLKVTRKNDGSVVISWDAPSAKGGPDLRYHVIVNGDKGAFQKYTNFRIQKKPKKQSYLVYVRSHTNAGFSRRETVEFEIQGTEKGIGIDIVIAIGVSFGFILIIAIVVIIYFYRRRHPKHIQTVRLENGEVKLPIFSSNRVYVDPTVYQDLKDAVREFAKEMERDWIKLESIIGGGEFGDVYRASLARPLEDEIIVAVKTLKANANKKATDDFLAEAAYMGQFEDPNVVALEGVVVKDRPIMIAIEFMSNGSLDSYLRDNDSKFSTLQLLSMARGVSSGMTYLSELSFIHRDLAARNILVNEDMVCKVADFGMSRELSDDDTYNTTGGKIPVRWTAPEAITYKKFTSASDVWSYGILMWEIMSYGERPYWDWGNYEVVERLATGYRLPPPMGCPKVVHDLMLSCWEKDRVKRRKFCDIRYTIDKWINNPELLRQEASVVTRRDENLDYASMSTLKEWLDSINMGQYIEKFTKKGLVTPRQILELSDSDLQEIGIFAVGHRNKIIKSIRVTKSQLDRSNSSLI